jgi:hypothetical protein
LQAQSAIFSLYQVLILLKSFVGTSMHVVVKAKEKITPLLFFIVKLLWWKRKNNMSVVAGEERILNRYEE